MKTRYYSVAGHGFCVTAGESDFGLMTNYAPFATSHQDPVFALTVGESEAPEYTEEFRQEEEGQVIICGSRITNSAERCGDAAEGLRREPVFEFCWDGQTAGWLVCSADYREARLLVTGYARKMAIDNALMILYALTTADKDTLLFHAAVVSHKGRGYMFLGKSGTGKSTHASLWLKHIEGTELLNDDNPVVRITDGTAIVYGSPWSGKTPCYRNMSDPLGGIVLLSQAPYNKIERLYGIAAYMAVVSSVSGMRWEKRIADGLHRTENLLVQTVATWHLECLPDKEAAEVCFAQMRNEE